MTENQREFAETVFERNERREAEINNNMKQEHARREATVKNMYRLSIKARSYLARSKLQKSITLQAACVVSGKATALHQVG